MTNQKFLMLEKPDKKIFVSENYNYLFDKTNGVFARWGKTKDDDPDYSPLGPEIADIEISTICDGIPNENGILTPCPFCYKGNTHVGKNMSLETFKKIFEKFPHFERNGKKVWYLTQIAFGLGTITANPDVWDIFKHCRENGVIPNVTVNGWNVVGDVAKKLAKFCGYVAVSRYHPVDYCYNAVQTLTRLGKKQTNIHMLLSEETYEDCLQVIRDAKEDERLKNLNAIVFLALKQHGRGKHYNKLSSLQKYKDLVEYAFENQVNIGFDSCSANSFLRSIEGFENYKEMEECVEPCESTLFSIYIDVDGNLVPCSFCPGESKWENGIPVIETENFLQEIWNGKRITEFRENLLKNVKDDSVCRCCPVYNLELKK